MAISVQCSCGKSFKVGDDKAGMRGKCPACGEVVTVPGARAVAAAPVAAPAQARSSASPRAQAIPANMAPFGTKAPPVVRGSHVVGPPTAAPSAQAGSTFSSMASAYPTRKRPDAEGGPGPAISVALPMRWVIFIGIAVAIVGTVLFLKYGPAKAAAEWQVASAKGHDDVLDVVTQAIQVHEATQGFWNRRDPRFIPGAKDVIFVDTGLMIHMPDQASFAGTSTEGRFTGTYGTRTGEVVAHVPSSTGMMNVTGRVKNGKPEVEIDGKPAIMPPMPPMPPPGE